MKNSKCSSNIGLLHWQRVSMFPSHFYSYYDQITMYRLVQALYYARHCMHLFETALIQQLHNLNRDRHEWEAQERLLSLWLYREIGLKVGDKLHISKSAVLSLSAHYFAIHDWFFSLLFFMVWGFNKAWSHWQIPARDHRECFLLNASPMSLAKFVPAS